MGAYNILFHFDKLSKRLGPLHRCFSPDYQGAVSTPTLLFPLEFPPSTQASCEIAVHRLILTAETSDDIFTEL
jgi:hypothetical protein